MITYVIKKSDKYLNFVGGSFHKVTPKPELSYPLSEAVEYARLVGGQVIPVEFVKGKCFVSNKRT